MLEIGTDEVTLGQFTRNVISNTKRHFRFMAIAGLVCGVLGYGLSMLIPVKYQATASLLPPVSNSPMGGMLAQLGAASGLLGGGGSGDFDRLYPDIVKSRRILGSVLRREYLGKPLASYLDVGMQPEVARERRQIELLHRTVHVRDNVRTGLIEISYQATDPLLATFVVDAILQELDVFLRANVWNQATAQVKMIEARRREIEVALATAEVTLKQFRENNLMISQSPALSLEHGRLAREVEICSETYIALTKQLELDRLQTGETGQVTRILDQADPEVDRAWPPRGKIAAMACLVGMLCGIGVGSRRGHVAAV